MGEIYQDEQNEAALLLYKDDEDDALLMDGTLGDDLVVRPLPAKLRQRLKTIPDPRLHQAPGLMEDYIQAANERPDESENDDVVNGYYDRELHDDYAFLDEDEDLEDEDIMFRSPNGLPSWQSRRNKRGASDDGDFIDADLHVVYKRKDSVEHFSDYRKKFECVCTKQVSCDYILQISWRRTRCLQKAKKNHNTQEKRGRHLISYFLRFFASSIMMDTGKRLLHY